MSDEGTQSDSDESPPKRPTKSVKLTPRSDKGKPSPNGKIKVVAPKASVIATQSITLLSQLLATMSLPEQIKYMNSIKQVTPVTIQFWREFVWFKYKIPGEEGFTDYKDLYNMLETRLPYDVLRLATDNEAHLLEYLIRHDFYKLDQDPGVQIAIIKACSDNQPKLLKLFLTSISLSELVDQAIIEGFSIACSLKHIDLVKMLLEDGRVDPDVLDGQAIITAINLKSRSLMEVLLKSPIISPSIQYNLPIRLCIERNVVGLLALLLKDPRITKLSIDDNYIVKLAVKNGNSAVIGLLLESDKIDWTANLGALLVELLRNVINLGLPELLQTLIADERVTTLSFNNNEIIKLALSKMDSGLIKALLKTDKVDWQANNNELFMEAVKLGDEEVVSLLLSSGKINPQNRLREALLLASGNDTLQGILLEYANKERIAK